MVILPVLLLTLSVFTTEAKNLSLRVVGGQDAGPKEFPYVLRIDFEVVVSRPGELDLTILKVAVCTASAITATWSLTAAHCLIKNLYPPTLVQIGVHTNKSHKIAGYLRSGGVTNNEAEEHGWLITSFVPYPGYSNTGSIKNVEDNTIKNDIGLLRSDPMQLPSFARVSAVDYSTLFGHEGNIAGYGYTHKVVNSVLFINSTEVLKLPLQVLKIMIQKCDLLKSDLWVSPCLSIARACGSSATISPGDSGGPLLHPSGLVAVATAAPHADSSRKILSYRRPRSGTVGLYTPVSPFLDWISLQIKTT